MLIRHTMETSRTDDSRTAMIPKNGEQQVLLASAQGDQDKRKTVDELLDEYFPDQSKEAEPQTLFSKFMMYVVMLSCAQVGAECQWRPSQSPHAERLYHAMNIGFAIIFSVEVVMKLHWTGMVYFKNRWNIMDFSLTVMMVLAEFFEQLVGVSSELLDMVSKSVRLARTARIVRVLRVLKLQPELVIVTEGLFKSSTSLAWIIVALSFFMYFFAVLFVLEVDHDIFAESDLGADASLCEKDKYFCNLTAALNTLLDVIVGATWSGVAAPLSQHQPWMMIPFLGFFIIACFGVVNVIVGVIVDATHDTKLHLEWGVKREKLRGAADMWQQQIVENGLGREMLKGLEGEALEAAKMKRSVGIERVVQTIIDSGIIDFPEGVQAKSIISLLTRNKSGELNQEDFTIMLGRLLLADQEKLLMQSLINQAKQTELVRDVIRDVSIVRQDVKAIDGRLDRMEAMLTRLEKAKSQ